MLDRGLIGKGMTARTSAHLRRGLRRLLQDLHGLRGLEGSKLFYQSQSAVNRIEAIQRRSASVAISAG